jgi:hypothetical protein
MIKKIGYLKNAIATPKGFYSAKGEKLKGKKLDDDFIIAWNADALGPHWPFPDAPIAQEEPVDVDQEIEKMTKVELVEFAAKCGVKLSLAKSKDQLVEAVKGIAAQ